VASLHVIVVPKMLVDFATLDSQTLGKMMYSLAGICMNSGIVLVLGLLTEFHLTRQTIKELVIEKNKLTKLNEEYVQLNQALKNTVHEKDDLILTN
jgi:hypothetical protein